MPRSHELISARLTISPPPQDAYAYFLSKKSAFAENAIFTELPPNLLNKLVLSIYSKEVHRVILFRDCEENFIVQLIIAAKPFQALPGTKIVLKGDVADELMFIMRGVVQFTTIGYTEDEGVVDAVTGYSSEGGYFGDFEYYKRTIRFVTHRAMCNCSLMAIPTSVLDISISRYPLTGDKITLELEKRYQNFLIASKSIAQKEEGYRYYIKELLLVDGVLDASVNHSGFSQSYSKRIHSTNTVLDVIRVIREIPDYRTGRMMEEHAEEHADDVLRLGLILPKSPQKISWDIFIGSLIFYSALIIPVQIGFDKSPSVGLKVLDQIVDILFGIDMLVSLRTCYFDETEDAYVIIPRRVYRHYFITWFLIDFFSIMPFDLLLGGSTDSNILGSLKLLKVIRLVRLLKLFRLMKLRKYLTRIEDSVGINPATFEIIKMVLEVAFIGHLTSCVYWYLSASLSDYAWFDKLDLRGASLSDQYIATLYWTFTTLSTVGYGDITPVDTPGQVVSTMIMILGGTVFGYIVANVSGLMSSLDVTSTRVNERIAEVSEYLAEKNASSGLSESIVKHVRYMFTQNSVFDERAIISRLPLHLSRQMIFFHHSETLSHISIFRYIESKGVILFLFRMLTPVFYDANNYLCVEGTVAHELIFLVSGKANVFKARIQHQFLEMRGARSTHLARSASTANTTIPIEMCDLITHLSPGDFFGYVSMMLRKPYQASVRSHTPCSIYSLHTHDITSLIHNFPAVAITLQSSLAQAVHSRHTRGRYERRNRRARFIEDIASLYVKHTAHNAALNPPPTADAGPSILAGFRSRSFKRVKAAFSKDSASPTPTSRANNILLPSPAATPTAGAIGLKAPQERNDLKVENFEEGHSRSQSLPPQSSPLSLRSHQKKYSVSQVVPMDGDLTEVTNPSEQFPPLAPARPSPSSAAAQARWNVLRAVVHDPAVIGIIQESLSNRQRADDGEEMKVEGAGRRDSIESSQRTTIRFKPAKKRSVFSQRSLSIASVVRASMATKKKQNIFVLLLQGNEYYDSDEDKKLYDEFYFVKTKGLQRGLRSCPNLTGLAYKQHSHLTSKKLRRRVSFPLFDTDLWQESQQSQHLV
jgi:CRP-like cAMP-binding protein